MVNLTNHAYFNLRGEAEGGALENVLKLNASCFLETDADQITTGRRTPVEGTPMDFREPKPLGRDINADYEPLRFGYGYDHCWAIDGWEPGRLTDFGFLYDPQSGRRMTIRSTQPGVQIYTGNWLEGCPRSISGHEYRNRDGVAIECQAFPDSPNKPEFPSVVLRPGEIYERRIVYRFDTL